MAGSGDTESTTTSIGEDVDLLYRMDEEDPTKRYDAATWLRKRVGVVAAKDLPAEPSEEDFRQGLRSGMILCNVLNKIQSGAVPKVVDAPSAVFYTPDAAAQSAYFENIRNFLMAIEEMGLPTFEPSDLELGGDFSRVVNSVLALKAYSETGSRRFSWTSKSSQSGKPFVRRNSEPSINVISRTQSVSSEKSFDTADQIGDGYELNEESDSGPLYMIVCDLLEDKEEEDIPLIVENILNKVKEEFESRLGVHMPKDENGLSTTEPPRSCSEDIKPFFKDVNNKREDTTEKTEKEEFETRDDDQDDKEKESLSLKENASKQEEEEKAAKEQERIKRENELQALKEKARKQEEDDKAAKEQERINREKEVLAQNEQARKQEEERIKKEKELLAQKEKIRKQEEERIKKEKQLLAQKEKMRKREEEKMRKREEARARKERERIKREKELLALKEKAKQEMSAKELERINRERELLELEEKERQEEEEQERIEREQELLAKKERALKKEEFKRRMDEYNKLNVNTTRREELLDQQDKELQELRSTLSTAKTDVRSMQKSCQEEADNLGKHVQNLCQAAAGYKKVLEENRKLYNQVQDLKGSIRVYCRVRPFLAGQENHVTSVDYMDDETVTIIIPSKSGKEGRKASMFNKVFGPSATQEEVFSDTQPLIRSVLDGFNVCIFACGQTGSGKTYTLTGPEDLTPETMGVGYRALNDLFLISEERKNLMNYEISINMLDVYNDEIRDLLVTDGTSKILDICNGAKKGINVPDANLVPVSSTDEVINLMNLCQKNRAVNDHSSRSHSFLTVHVFGKDLTAGTTIRGCMHLVDLAGSEKLDSSDDEATHIQKSLSALGDVLVALANKSKNVPYKTCKLTQLLQDALGAQAKILMFVHVHPDIDEALETLNTFKFVERFSTLEGGAGKSSEVRDLKEQICYMKAALAKKESGDPQWQDFSLNSPRSGKESGFGDILSKQNDASEEESIDESAPSKLKNPNLKPPTKSPSLKKLTAGAVAAAKLGKQQTTLDSKKKKGK